MLYRSFTDMLLDNREGVRREMIENGANEETIDTAMVWSDYLAMQLLKYSALLKMYEEKYGSMMLPEVLSLMEAAPVKYCQEAEHNGYPDYGYNADEPE